MIKKLSFLLLALLLVAAPSIAYASVSIAEDGTKEGEAYQLNFSTNMDVSVSDGIATITTATTEDLTFRTNLLANGRYGSAALILQSSSTPIGASQLAYAVIQKRIGGAGGLDGDGIGTALANGTIGQVISLIVIYREGSGTWVVTPVTKTGFTTLTFDAVGENATLLNVSDTVGWIIQGSNCTVA